MKKETLLFFPAGAAVQFVFKKTAVDLAGIKLDAAAGFEADLFGQFQVAGKDISEIALAFLFEEIAQAFIRELQVFFRTQAVAIFGVEINDPITGFRNGRMAAYPRRPGAFSISWSRRQ